MIAAKYVIKQDSMDTTSSKRKEERERKAERRQHSQQSKPARMQQQMICTLELGSALPTTHCPHNVDNEPCLESRQFGLGPNCGGYKAKTKDDRYVQVFTEKIT